jgi:hypothetical protein
LNDSHCLPVSAITSTGMPGMDVLADLGHDLCDDRIDRRPQDGFV